MYSPSIQVKDNRGDSATISSTAVVAGPVLTPISTTVTPDVGVPFSGRVASFLDTNGSADTLSATITWGDGHVSKGTPQSIGAGLYNILGMNTYTSPGTYQISVLVVNSTGQSATANSTAIVTAPTIIATGTTFVETPGQQLTNQTVAMFTDTSGAADSSIVATINWGDGTTSLGQVVKPTLADVYSVTGTHTYYSAGSQTIPVTVTIADPNGQTATASSSAIPLVPSLTPIPTQVLFTAGYAGPDAIGGTVPPIGSFYYNATPSAFVETPR